MDKSAFDILSEVSVKNRENIVRDKVITDPKIISTLKSIGIYEEYDDIMYTLKTSSNFREIKEAQLRLKSFKDIIDNAKAIAEVSKKTEDVGSDSYDEIKVTMIYEVDKKDFE